jgi:hypothetical protein
MLASEIVLLRTNAANALAEIGDGCLPDVVKYLSDLSREDGALIALDQLSAWKEAERVREYIQSKVESALRHESIRNAIDPAKDDRWKLLAESLHNRAIQDAINALRGLSLLGERESILVAVDNLKSRQQISNALETLETIRYAAMIRPLFQIWESGQPPEQDIDVEAELAQILKEDDHWLRACIRFVEEGKNYTMVTLSSMERVLLLRRVPLLADLSPADLLRVSAISTEENFDSAEIICEQGESGDKMYVIVTGEVRIVVTTDDQSVKEVARRKTGDVVGEMSLISGDARIASVIASSDVRTLCIDRLSFESLLRERPEVSLAVMRELCVRLKAMSVAS